MLTIALVTLALLVVQGFGVVARQAIGDGRAQTAADSLALAAAKGSDLDVLLAVYQLDSHEVVIAADDNGITATVQVVRDGRAATSTAFTPTLETRP